MGHGSKSATATAHLMTDCILDIKMFYTRFLFQRLLASDRMPYVSVFSSQSGCGFKFYLTAIVYDTPVVPDLDRHMLHGQSKSI